MQKRTRYILAVALAPVHGYGVVRFARQRVVHEANEASLADLDKDPGALVVEPLNQLSEAHRLHQVAAEEVLHALSVVRVGLTGRGRP